MLGLEPRGTDFTAAQCHPTLVLLENRDRDEEAPAHPGLPSPHILGIEDPRATNRASFQAGAGAELAASSPSDLAEKPFCCGSHRSHSPAHRKEWLASCPSIAIQTEWTPPCGLERGRAPVPPRPPVLPLGPKAARLCLSTHEITQKIGVSHPSAIPANAGDSRPQGTFRAQQYHPQHTAQVTSGPAKHWQRPLPGCSPCPKCPLPSLASMTLLMLFPPA